MNHTRHYVIKRNDDKRPTIVTIKHWEIMKLKITPFKIQVYITKIQTILGYETNHERSSRQVPFSIKIDMDSSCYIQVRDSEK